MAGSDADLVTFDPHKQVTFSTDVLHENVYYTPYAGLTLTGWPVATLVRGQAVVREGQWVGRAPGGQFLKRSLPLTGGVEGN